MLQVKWWPLRRPPVLTPHTAVNLNKCLKWSQCVWEDTEKGDETQSYCSQTHQPLSWCLFSVLFHSCHVPAGFADKSAQTGHFVSLTLSIFIVYTTNNYLQYRLTCWTFPLSTESLFTQWNANKKVKKQNKTQFPKVTLKPNDSHHKWQEKQHTLAFKKLEPGNIWNFACKRTEMVNELSKLAIHFLLTYQSVKSN